MPYTILLTTSRSPSYRTRSFIKDFSSALPGILRTHRGKKTILEIALEARRYQAKYVAIVGEKKGNPSILRFYRVNIYSKIYGEPLKQVGTLILAGVSLSRELPEASRVYNPETVSINVAECISDNCFMIGDLFIKLFQDHIRPVNADVRINIIEERDIYRIEFRSRVNRICGPILRVKRVKLFET